MINFLATVFVLALFVLTGYVLGDRYGTHRRRDRVDVAPVTTAVRAEADVACAAPAPVNLQLIMTLQKDRQAAIDERDQARAALERALIHQDILRRTLTIVSQQLQALTTRLAEELTKRNPLGRSGDAGAPWGPRH